MEKDLITIVVPIYNAEKYLKNMIPSIMRQTYTYLEILLIDDDSKDSSLAICEKYAKEDTRIQVIKKQHSGLSDTRNYGISMAKGKYITFIDADDQIKLDYIEYLYHLLKKYNTRMAIGSYKLETQNGKSIDYGKGFQETVLDTEECLERMLCEKGFSISAWGKLYETALFHDVKYPEGKVCEDTATTYQLIMQCEKIAYGNEEKYIYEKHENSITTRKFDKARLDVITLTDEMAEALEPRYPRLRNAIERRVLYARFSVLRQIANDKQVDKNLKKSLRKEILNKWKCFFVNPKMTKRDRIAFFFLLFGNTIFGKAWNIYEKICY